MIARLVVAVEKIKIIVGLCVFALVMSTGWQIASCEFTNYLLRDDLRDLAVMGGTRMGLAGPGSDAELRNAVIRRARGRNVHLVPDQILVRRSGTKENPVVFLAAKYQRRVVMPGFSLIFHFTATSGW